MREFLDSKIIGLQMRAGRFLADLRKEERGDTNFVSIIIIIVIVLGVAAIFQEGLKKAMENIMKQLDIFTK